MSDLVTVHGWPQLKNPILVLGFEGWIDAGAAASSAVSTLDETFEFDLVASFDCSELIDYRARRPTLTIANGVNEELVWPEITIEVAQTQSRSILLLSGPEPDMKWPKFVSEVVTLASRFNVELVVGLGGFPAPVPHTRPIKLASTATSEALAQKVGFIPATIDVPAGIQGALEFAFGQAAIDAVGLWARVPHYAAAMPYPEAAAVLLDEFSRLTNIDINTESLHVAAAATAHQIAEMISSSDEHQAMVRQLEEQQDAEEDQISNGFGDLPSGDEIAAELERFLRGQP